MGSVFLQDFKFGMDRRRARVASTPGTLWTAENVVITRGGDIERAKKFVSTYTLPAGQTFGLAELRGQLWTFGTATAPVVPVGVNYQQLVSPSGAAITAILDARASGGKLYVIVQFADGNIFHYYDGARITDWDAVAASGFTYPVLADYFALLLNSDPAVQAQSIGNAILISAKVPGVPFTISRTTQNRGSVGDQDILLATTQANVPAAAEVRASTTVQILSGTTGSISSLTINGVQLLWSSVSFATDLTTLATALAQSINNLSHTHGYIATASGQNVLIQAAVGLGVTPNGYLVVTTSSGDLNLAAPALSGGVAAAAGVAQVVTATLLGTPEALDLFVLTINGTNYNVVGAAASTGTSALVSTRRIFSTAGSLVVWSALNAPTDWHTHSGLSDGTGFINVSNDAEGSERLIGLGVYLTNQMAAMTRRNIRLYTLDTDATQIGLVQPLDNTGALAARSILAFGSTNLFYLADSGVRSLKPRDTTNTAFADDIGTAIDTFVRAQLDGLAQAQFGKAVAVMEPRDDRFWLAVDNTVYVLNYFPSSQISGWTYLKPGFIISAFARVYDKLFVRSGDTIYQYGGATGNQYPDADELVSYLELPFAASTPPGKNVLTGYDQAGAGEWEVFALPDPNNENAQVNVGTLDHITYGQDDISVPGRGTHLAFNLRCRAAGYASISNIAVHTDNKEREN